MFEDSIEVHRKDGRVFSVTARAYYPTPTEEDEEKRTLFKPFISEFSSNTFSHMLTLESEETSEDAINAGVQFLKYYEK